MTMETDLQALLLLHVPRVFPTVAPEKPATPYCVWQLLGGKTLRYLANDAPDKRNSLVQVYVSAPKSSEAIAAIRGIEDALCATTAFVAQPVGEAFASFDEDTKLFGAVQRFSITAPR